MKCIDCKYYSIQKGSAYNDLKNGTCVSPKIIQPYAGTEDEYYDADGYSEGGLFIPIDDDVRGLFMRRILVVSPSFGCINFEAK